MKAKKMTSKQLRAGNSSSDRVLLIIGLIAVVVSAIALLLTLTVRLTGFQVSQDTGQVDVNVASSASISFTRDIINWGTGTIPSGGGTFNTDGGIAPPGFSADSNGLILENIGNVDVDLFIKSAQDAAAFIGGTTPAGPEYKFKVRTCNDAGVTCTPSVPTGSPDDTLEGCVFAVSPLFSENTYYDLTATDRKVCDRFNFEGEQDELRLDIRLFVPEDSNVGALADTITATAQVVVP